jgi:hypothetical protein
LLLLLLLPDHPNSFSLDLKQSIAVYCVVSWCVLWFLWVFNFCLWIGAKL